MAQTSMKVETPKPAPGTGRVRFREAYGKYARNDVAPIPLGEIESEEELYTEKTRRFDVLMLGDPLEVITDDTNQHDLPIG